jgi:phage terminase large subunit-like protein
VKLARRFRELAGFTKEEIDDIADVSAEAAEETMAQVGGRKVAPVTNA